MCAEATIYDGKDKCEKQHEHARDADALGDKDGRQTIAGRRTRLFNAMQMHGGHGCVMHARYGRRHMNDVRMRNTSEIRANESHNAAIENTTAITKER
jgi:hypothetical protein